METLQTRFLPEFLNRIDETIVFHPLDRSQIRKIVDLQIEHLAKLLEQRDFGLEVTEAARQEIANRGYDPTYGARPLKRVIQQRAAEPAGVRTAEEATIPEGSTVRIDFDGEEFTFESLSNGRPPGSRKGDEIVSAQVL